MPQTTIQYKLFELQLGNCTVLETRIERHAQSISRVIRNKLFYPVTYVIARDIMVNRRICITLLKQRRLRTGTQTSVFGVAIMEREILNNSSGG